MGGSFGPLLANIIMSEFKPGEFEFEKFDRNLMFDRFENQNPHFLDMEITSSGLKIYSKETFTRHDADFSRFIP